MKTSSLFETFQQLVFGWINGAYLISYIKTSVKGAHNILIGNNSENSVQISPFPPNLLSPIEPKIKYY